VLSHTHSTEKALDSLLETLNTTNTNITNVTNDFLCLANTQFLESRVYDDDDIESPQETPAVDSKQEAVSSWQYPNILSFIPLFLSFFFFLFFCFFSKRRLMCYPK